MIGPQVQKTIVATLKNASLAVGNKVYDHVPKGAEFPYVTVGDEQTIDTGDQCGELYTDFINVHVWSRKTGNVEAKQIGEAVRRALNVDLTVDDYDVILNQFESSQVIDDPDGLTTHAVLTFRFLLQKLE